MQKVSYMGDGSTTEFYFNFPFYNNSDIIVLKNNQPATNYLIVGTDAGLNADIPYIGGKVVFTEAPLSTDNIIIYRHIPLTRVVDYQPTEKINPTNLNQDMNYMIEVLKDMYTELKTFDEVYNDIINNPSVETLLTKIDYVKQLFDNNEVLSLQNFYSFTTNCITQIPQDLKFTLTNGTLTLKAGSKIRIPSGQGTFNTVSITSDLSVNPSSFSTSSKRMIVFINNQISVLDTVVPYIYSGTTEPTVFDSNGRALWYDTTNNIIKKTSDSGTTWQGGYSFPLALVEITNGTGITGFNQIFNGAGFIGRTLFILPGVKALHSNGFYENGTLKNDITVVNNVITHTSGTNDILGQIILKKDGTSCQLTVSTNSWKYDKNRNIFYFITNGDTNWIDIGTYYYDSSLGYISQFKTKTVFHMYDYNDVQS